MAPLRRRTAFFSNNAHPTARNDRTVRMSTDPAPPGCVKGV